MTTTRYIHPHIELCEKCKGEGQLAIYANWDVLNQHAEMVQCPTCEGTGRVLVSRKIEVTVVAFKTEL